MLTTLKFSYIYQFKLFRYYFSSCLTLLPQTVHLAYCFYLLQVRASRERIEEAQSDSEDDDDADIFHMVSLHSSLASHVVFFKFFELHSFGCLYYTSPSASPLPLPTPFSPPLSLYLMALRKLHFFFILAFCMH